MPLNRWHIHAILPFEWLCMGMLFIFSLSSNTWCSDVFLIIPTSHDGSKTAPTHSV
ncbi:hypothetical protein CPB83DRAFT_521249 [Crepidotus variabilis]|uniref:Uncharacterized protein n=1 Tax=Crepidotus variabilis TaxID=179855 RepID=A0A9P6EAA7_9AGAR|nr:hypothetical protein CPB83DRAFT_521249 [Crepidotus variabilis]